MAPHFDRQAASRHLTELLPKRLRRRLHRPPDHFGSLLVEDAVLAHLVPQVDPDGQRLPRGHLLPIPHCRVSFAMLLHVRSPFSHLWSAVFSITGSLAHPEGDRPSHPISALITAPRAFFRSLLGSLLWNRW